MSRVAGLLLGFGVDQLLGDPRRWHPVAGFGRLAKKLEERTYAAERAPGAAHVALLVLGSAGLGSLFELATRGGRGRHTLAMAAVTWVVLGGRSLTLEAETIQRQLTDGDLAAARQQVSNLVGRDPSVLDADEVARACIESVAENTSDAVVAPLLWGGLLGLPGLLGYRAVNTLDAMIGHRTPRYDRFGWAAARLDDAANWVPARLAGALALAAAPLVATPRCGDRRGSARAGWVAIRRDAPHHPSPNGGVVEAAFAGVLGVRLGGTNIYAGRPEDRGTLGDGPVATAADIARAARLSTLVQAASAASAGVLAAATARAFTRRAQAS